MPSINAQFAHPNGFWGLLAGMIMAYENRERIAWAVSQLDPQPGERILEIGFGAGVAIRRLSKVISDGWVAGVDSSAVMVRLASRQNKAAIREGRVVLRQAPAEALPYSDGFFDKVMAINSFHIWVDPAAGLSQIRRVLKNGGVIAIVEQPIASVSAEEAEAISNKLCHQIRAAGFVHAHASSKPMRTAPTICVMAEK